MTSPNQLFSNNAVALLDADLSALALTIQVQPGYGALYPAPSSVDEYFLVTLESAAAPLTREIVKCSGRSGDMLIVAPGGRGWENTAAQSWTAGDVLVDHRITAGTISSALMLPDQADLSLSLYSENTSSPTNAIATAPNSLALGFASTAAAEKSLAIGEQSLSRIPGSAVMASGRFGTQGDAQKGTYLVRNVSTASIPVELLVDGPGGNTRLVLPDNSTWTFRATITAHETSSGNGRAGFEILGVIYRDNGAVSTSIQGKINITNIARSAVWHVNAVADTTNGSLKILVTGQNSKTIRWMAHIETVELTN